MSKHLRLFALAAVLMGVAPAMVGCTPWATYPHLEGAVDITDPGLAPIPDLMADAIWYAYNEDGAEGAIVYNLPQGTPAPVYQAVTNKLGGGWPMRDSDTWAYHVTAVRVRASEAEVDLIWRRGGGEPKLVTLKFRQRFTKGFQVADTRVWRFKVTEPGPHFIASPAIMESIEAVAAQGNEPAPEE